MRMMSEIVPPLIVVRMRQEGEEMRMRTDDETEMDPPPVSGFSSDECSAENIMLKLIVWLINLKIENYSFCQIGTVNLSSEHRLVQLVDISMDWES